jgi:perosamine synthetase
MSNTEVMPTSFEPGVAPSPDTIPLCVPEIRGNEWEYVKECLDTNWVSSAGPFVNRFEKSIAEYVGAKHAVAIVNGTAALHLALLVAGVQPEDEVLVPALTFIAPVNAVSYAGARPVFIDVEPNHWQLDVEKLDQFVRQECAWKDGELRNKISGRCVKAILPVHILGHPCDMDSIMDVARRFELRVIEDATESLGARYKGRMVGTDGDIACFSFNGNKVITTGGGGMVVTNNSDLARQTRYLSTQAKDDPIEYIHQNIGYNYRMPNIQAAIGCAQLEVLDTYVQTKRRIFADYKAELGGLPGIGFQKESEQAASIFWMSTITVDSSQTPCDSRSLMKQLATRKIQTRPLWHPIHTLPPYKDCQSYEVEIADHLYSIALSLPSSVGLTDEDQQRVIEGVKAALT